MAYAILKRISGLEPSSVTTAPRYLKLVTVPSFCPFAFIPLCASDEFNLKCLEVHVVYDLHWSWTNFRKCWNTIFVLFVIDSILVKHRNKVVLNV